MFLSAHTSLAMQTGDSKGLVKVMLMVSVTGVQRWEEKSLPLTGIFSNVWEDLILGCCSGGRNKLSCQSG